MSVDLTGKVALVTGAARGMGEAEARLFVALGAQVVLTDLREDEGRAAAASLGSAARFVRHDVTDETSWEAAVAAAVDGFGRLDVLVNNAAIYTTSPIVEEAPGLAAAGAAAVTALRTPAAGARRRRGACGRCRPPRPGSSGRPGRRWGRAASPP